MVRYTSGGSLEEGERWEERGDSYDRNRSVCQCSFFGVHCLLLSFFLSFLPFFFFPFSAFSFEAWMVSSSFPFFSSIGIGTLLHNHAPSYRQSIRSPSLTYGMIPYQVLSYQIISYHTPIHPKPNKCIIVVSTSIRSLLFPPDDHAHTTLPPPS